MTGDMQGHGAPYVRKQQWPRVGLVEAGSFWALGSVNLGHRPY